MPGRRDTPWSAKVLLEVGTNVRSTVLRLGLRLRWESTVWHILSDFILRIQIGRYTHLVDLQEHTAVRFLCLKVQGHLPR